MHPFVALCFYTAGIIIFAATWLKPWFHGRRAKEGGANLPPGSLGWPLIGETLHFAKTQPATFVGEFVESRIKRYGKIFKTHLIGNPTIISADLDFNLFVLRNDGTLFKHGLPQAYEKLFGEILPGLGSPEVHRSVKNIFTDFLGIPSLRSRFFQSFELFTLQVLGSWKDDACFHAQEEASKVTFYIIVKAMLNLNPGDADTKELQRMYLTFVKGFASLPLDAPGTNFRKAKESRETIVKIIKRLKDKRMREREAGRDEIGTSDYLGVLLDRCTLTEEQTINHMIGLILGGYGTSSTALALAIYFLGRCPRAVQELREEHLRISDAKKGRGEQRGLTWEDYKQMEFTQCVIRETTRLGNIARYVLRKAKADIKYKGYDIPCGWSVMPFFAATHLDDKIYNDPQRFDPWMWLDVPACKEKLKNYMPFSQGFYKCAGMDLAKLEMAIFLHYLVLNFDWELAEPDHPM